MFFGKAVILALMFHVFIHVTDTGELKSMRLWRRGLVVRHSALGLTAPGVEF